MPIFEQFFISDILYFQMLSSIAVQFCTKYQIIFILYTQQ